MAEIKHATLEIVGQADAVVDATVRYTLIRNLDEKNAGTTFSEAMSLIGGGADDGVGNEVVIQGFGKEVVGEELFAADPKGLRAKRERTIAVLKSRMNENPDFEPTGAEQRDEVRARINLEYDEKAPAVEALPGEVTTNFVKGAWK